MHNIAKGMFEGNRKRKTTLVDHGWRLPSALDNRPLTGNEFWSSTSQTVFVSATPGTFERDVCTAEQAAVQGAAARASVPAVAARTAAFEPKSQKNVVPSSEVDRAIAKSLSRLETNPGWGPERQGRGRTGGSAAGNSMGEGGDGAGGIGRAGSGGVDGEWWDAEAVLRPTGIVDPPVAVLPSRGQVRRIGRWRHTA